MVSISFLCFVFIASIVTAGYKMYYSKAYPIKYEESVRISSRRHAVEPALIYAMIKTESGFRNGAKSRVGARGLMQLMPQTFTWLRERGVKILGYHTDYCTGYVFYSAHEKLDGTFDTVPMERTGKTLLLNPIPMEDRIQDNQILEQAVKEALEAVKRGEYFHPAANGAIDKLTDGKSSYIQLASIVENAKLAENIAKTR